MVSRSLGSTPGARSSSISLCLGDALAVLLLLALLFGLYLLDEPLVAFERPPLPFVLDGRVEPALLQPRRLTDEVGSCIPQTVGVIGARRGAMFFAA